MGVLTRFLDRKRVANARAEADLAHSRILSGQSTGQTAAEIAATRGRMELEMDAQRRRRTRPPETALSD